MSGFHAGAMGVALSAIWSRPSTCGEQLHAASTGGPVRNGHSRDATATGATASASTSSNCPADRQPSRHRRRSLHVNPLNFSDIGYDTPGNEVHSDGEILGRDRTTRSGQALIDKYNLALFPAGDATLQASCAAGDLPSTNCPGNRRRRSSFRVRRDAARPGQDRRCVDARNSLLAADVMRYARRQSARSRSGRRSHSAGRVTQRRCNESTVNDTNPVPDFASPLENNAQVTFSLVLLASRPGV